jgi:1-deoxy-D-xylulose-5-phosphate reductoisomerase
MAGIKSLAVLGSTGSIGRQTLEIVRSFPGRFRVLVLAAGGNLELLAQQIEEFKPRYIYSRENLAAPGGVTRLADMAEAAQLEAVDIVVAATPGYSGLSSVLSAVRAGKVVALANKESLVSAGELITAVAAASGAQLRPIDSEHSAIWQCLRGEPNRPSKLILTASGGPFRNYTTAELAGVSAEQALRHPCWNMGPKVTVDSATLMNKGLEVMEARWLFDVPYEKIEVLIHPQSIIHSMVEFADGAVKAQLGAPDMRLPIQYALAYPERLDNDALPRVDFGLIQRLEFEKPDITRFPCLALAIEAGRKGATYPAALCAADEAAVGLFLEGRLNFNDIPRLIAAVLEAHQPSPANDIVAIEQADSQARQTVLRIIAREKMHC